MNEERELSESTDANENTGITRDASHERNFSMGDIGNAIGGVLGHEVFPSKGHPHTTEQAQTADTAGSASGTAGSMSDSASSVNDAIGGAAGNAPWNAGEQAGNVNNSGPITADEAAILNPGAVGLDEEFAGTGGVGSASYMDALRRGHMEAGGDYTSDLGDGGNIPDTDGAQGHT